MNRLKLSSEQQRAVMHTTGPALVVAGPGSGKTAVLVNRIANLIRCNNINPNNILVITFSKPAAVQMQQRFESSAGEYFPVTFGTFHSVFYNIVRQSSGYSKETVATANFKRGILTKIIRDVTDKEHIEPEYLDLIIKRISYYKNSSQTADKQELCDLDNQSFFKVYEEYNNALKSSSKLDFEDMMLRCKKLLEEREDIRKYWQNRFRYILIDEFQDINRLQFEIIRLLLGKDNNIFAVGDDDQSIYGFRGSEPGIMKEFSTVFENTVLIKMTCNYRSTSSIIGQSALLIGENKNRFSKDIHTHNTRGESVIIQGYESGDDELENITERAICDVKNGHTVAILCRTNMHIADIAEYLTAKNIPYFVTETPHSCYDSIIFRDFIRYMRLSVYPDNIESSDFIPVMNKPLRYLSRQKITGKHIDLTLLKGIYKDKEYVVSAIKKLEYDLRQISRMDMFSAFNYFRRVIGYDDHMKKEHHDDNKAFNRYLEDADKLALKLKGYSYLNDLLEHVEKVSVETEKKKTIAVSGAGLYVITYHGSKGLEFDSVYIPGLMEGSVPSKKSVTQEDIEEERRMLYVAMTRARYKLHLSYIKGKKGDKHIMSRYLKPLMASTGSIKC